MQARRRENLLARSYNWSMANKFKWVLNHFEEILCVILFAIMAIITFANVITRYLFHYSLAFTEEIVVSFFVWLTLLGSAIAFRQRAHLGFSFLIERLSPKSQEFFIWLSAALGIGLFLLLIYFSIRQIMEEIVLAITSSGIGIPQWWYTIGVPLWSVLVISRLIQGAKTAQQNLKKQ